MKLLDTHTHVISPDKNHYPTNPIGGHQSEWSQARPVDADGLLRAMDAAGIEQAVVVQASTVYGHDNRYVTDSVRQHRDRFVGVYSLDAMAADAVEKIQHWQAQGLHGFRLFTTGSTMPGQADWLGHADSYPAWAYAEAQGIPVCLQMTMEGIPALRSLLTRFPKAIVLLDHCARPVLSDGAPYAKAQALFDLASFPGVHLKLTNRTLAAAAEGDSTPAAFLERIVASFGAERIAWGSNFPAAAGTLAELAQVARAALSTLPSDAQVAIFGGTAQRLYPFADTMAQA
ncbi:Predicted metal-dependent hydrolase, TIM-barrel fold [Pseudoxanthomonas sp. GM95]|uniref:amidohydrolase family protein n=1 Tax=Pseudoxanthomonas sp. GM95 TaxID=1881043 RepID=UPI0008B645C8|nr:amidohydrolase family protein [Pseudoxanthomonas sp. GM95]SEL58932.1 Predicted metal-dependent hydrolase, TIM-barrel fold [Pseudoxanthomonas sp. GM95]